MWTDCWETSSWLSCQLWVHCSQDKPSSPCSAIWPLDNCQAGGRIECTMCLSCLRRKSQASEIQASPGGCIPEAAQEHKAYCMSASTVSAHIMAKPTIWQEIWACISFQLLRRVWHLVLKCRFQWWSAQHDSKIHSSYFRQLFDLGKTSLLLLGFGVSWKLVIIMTLQVWFLMKIECI